MPPELNFLSHSASLPWLLGAAALLSLGAILVLAGLTALFGLHPLRFVTRTLATRLLPCVASTVLTGCAGGSRTPRVLLTA